MFLTRVLKLTIDLFLKFVLNLLVTSFITTVAVLDLHASGFIFLKNLSKTYIVSNLIFHAHTKQIGLDYHFIQEHNLMGPDRGQFFSSIDQLADIFTKCLHMSRFYLH